MAAMTGASLRDLMSRMGHDSMRAALVYQHRTQGADRRIADAMEALIAGVESVERQGDGNDDGEPDGGAAGALVPARTGTSGAR
jgi:hypothetical protein